mgnify:CR=1 FL=1
MKNVVIRGPLMNSAGYGVHARQIFSYIKDKGHNIHSQVTPWGICPFYIDEKYENGLLGDIIKSCNNDLPNFDVSFQVQLPSEWDHSLAAYNVGVTAGVETSKCSKAWVDCINKMDLVIVPSNHTKKTLESSGNITTKIEIVPEYIQPSILEKELEPMNLDLKTNFNFLMFGLITGQTPDTDRKNTFYGIKWLCDAFKDDPDVGIVIKTNLGRMSVIDRKDTLIVLRKLLSEVRTGDYPKFYLSHGMMTTEELSAFYRSPDLQVLVSFTRGEGYGLPLLEAASSALPVMATGWSGHMDFLGNIKFSSFNYDLIDVHPDRIDNDIFVQGSKWAHPQEDDVKKKLLKIKKSYQIPTEWAKNGSKYINANFNQAKIYEKYDDVLSRVLN